MCMQRFSFSGSIGKRSVCGFRINCPPEVTASNRDRWRDSESFGCTPEIDMRPAISRALLSTSAWLSSTTGNTEVPNNRRRQAAW